jgi:hypothetical protein
MKDKSLFTGSEPHGTYQVWHRDGDGGTYQHVVSARVGNLLAALVLPDLKKDTPEKDSVAELTEDRRPTTFGDVIVNPYGQAYRIDDTPDGPVFQLIHFTPEMHRRALFAEQLEEARAGVAEGLRAGVSFKQIMQEAGVYGVKPEEVETIRREVEKEGVGR